MASSSDGSSTASRTPIGAAFGDRPASIDALGFDQYVEALATFITSEETTPPLAVSIEGTWGAGKSSFMAQLERRLRERGQFTVRFNPWRHEGEDALWAAFMLTVLEDLSKKLAPRDRRRARRRLVLQRFDVRRGRAAVIRTVATTVVALLVVLGTAVLTAAFGPGFVGVPDETAVTATFGLGGAVTSFWGVWLWTRRTVVERIERQLRAYVRNPDYDGHVSFIENFHADLRAVLDAYVDRHRVFVFVDDLDRCEVPRAAELMQSINLMLSDDPRLVFLLGMDREKVAAGIAAKHDDLLPYLNVESHPAFGLDYGYAFIEKFVQIPFLIPQPSPEDVDEFVDELTAFQREYGRDLTEDDLVAADESAYPPVSPRNPPTFSEEYSLWHRDWSDDELRTVVGWAAPALAYNPRQIKKFINLYRLRALLADEVGVFLKTDLTLAQLGKFVTISLRWPRLLPELNRDPGMLTRLTAEALGHRFHDAFVDALPPGRSPAVDAGDDGSEPTARESGDEGDSSPHETELDGLPDAIRSEREWELFADLLLAGLYEEWYTPKEAASSLLSELPTEAAEHREAFFDEVSPDVVLESTGANLDANLAHVDVEYLLQISPRTDVPTETLEEAPYSQYAKSAWSPDDDRFTKR